MWVHHRCVGYAVYCVRRRRVGHVGCVLRYVWHVMIAVGAVDVYGTSGLWHVILR